MKKTVVFITSEKNREKFDPVYHKFKTYSEFTDRANSKFDYFLAFSDDSHLGMGCLEMCIDFKTKNLYRIVEM